MGVNSINKRLLRRSVAMVSLTAFLIVSVFNNTSRARTVSDEIYIYDIPAQLAPNVSDEFSVDTFMLPDLMGTVEGRYDAGEGSVSVIHILDAHCDYTCQMRIAEILKYLSDKYGISSVNLEGGAGEYDLSVFTRIKDNGIRKKVSDHFVSEGLVTGAEFFAINAPQQVELWGVENVDLYIANLNVYRNSLGYRYEADNYLEIVRLSLDDLKKHLYSREMMNFDLKYEGYKSGETGFKEYVSWLSAQARKTSVRLEDLKNICSFERAVIQEEAIDFNAANTERDNLVGEIKKTLPIKELEKFAAKVYAFSEGRISQKDFYTYLIHCAKLTWADTEQYPMLSRYIQYVFGYEDVDKKKVMAEIETLGDRLVKVFCKTPEEKELARLSKNLYMIENLFNLRLTREDYSYYMANKRAFETRGFTSFIDRQSSRYGISLRVGIEPEKMDLYRENLTGFYLYSFERDEVFLKNMKFSGASVLVTGGFHADNLSDLFRENGVSYVSIMPNFRKCDKNENPYFTLLAGERGKTEKKLYPVIARAFALQIASSLSGAIAREVWGADYKDVYRAAVYISEQIARGNRVVLLTEDGREIRDGQGQPLTFGESGSETRMTAGELFSMARENRSREYFERERVRKERFQSMKLPGGKQPQKAAEKLRERISRDAAFKAALKEKAVTSSRTIELYTGEDGKPVGAVVIYEDLGKEAGAAFMSDNILEEGTPVIIINNNDLYLGRDKKPMFEKEALYHEKREAYWYSRGVDADRAHRLASTEQAYKYSVRTGDITGLTPYHAYTLKLYEKASKPSLEYLDMEYRTTSGRAYMGFLLAQASEYGDIDVDLYPENRGGEGIGYLLEFRRRYEKEFNEKVVEARIRVTPEDMRTHDLSEKILETPALQKSIGEIIAYGIAENSESGFGIEKTENGYMPGDIKKGGTVSMPRVATVNGMIHYHPLIFSSESEEIYVHLLSPEDFSGIPSSMDSSTVTVWGSEKTGFWATEVIGYYYNEYIDTAFESETADLVFPEKPKDIMPGELIDRLPEGSILFHKLVPADVGDGYKMRKASKQEIDRALTELKDARGVLAKEWREKNISRESFIKWRQRPVREIEDSIKETSSEPVIDGMKKALEYARMRELAQRLRGKDDQVIELFNNIRSTLADTLYDPEYADPGASDLFAFELEELGNTVQREEIASELKNSGLNLEIKVIPVGYEQIKVIISDNVPTHWTGKSDTLCVNRKDIDDKRGEFEKRGCKVLTNETSLNAIIIRLLAERNVFLREISEFIGLSKPDHEAVAKWLLSGGDQSVVEKAREKARKASEDARNLFVNNIISATENKLKEVVKADLEGKRLTILRGENNELLGLRGSRMEVYEYVDVKKPGVIVKFVRPEIPGVTPEEIKEVYLAAAGRLGELFAPIIVEDLKVELEVRPGVFEHDKMVAFAIVQEKVDTVDRIWDNLSRKENTIKEDIKNRQGELKNIGFRRFLGEGKERKKELEAEIVQLTKELEDVKKAKGKIIEDKKALWKEMETKHSIRDWDEHHWLNNYGYLYSSEEEDSRLVGFDADRYYDTETGRFLIDMVKSGELNDADIPIGSRWRAVPSAYSDVLSSEMIEILAEMMGSRARGYMADVTLAAGEAHPADQRGVHSIIEQGIPGEFKDFMNKTRTEQDSIKNKYRRDGTLVIPVKGLVRGTGLLAHIGLGQYYGEPVIYMEKMLDAVETEIVLDHERYEIKKWEELREKSGGETINRPYTPHEMREWIRNNSAQDGSGPAQELARKWHSEAHDITPIFDKWRKADRKSDLRAYRMWGQYQMGRAERSLEFIKDSIRENRAEYEAVFADIMGVDLKGLNDVYIEVKPESPNLAFADYDAKKISVWIKLAEELDDDELIWVVGHEFNHLQKRAQLSALEPQRKKETKPPATEEISARELSSAHKIKAEDYFRKLSFAETLLVPQFREYIEKRVYNEELGVDMLGAFFLMAGGRDPAKAISAYRKVDQVGEVKRSLLLPSKDPGYDTHPETQVRIDNMLAFIEDYTNAKVKRIADIYPEGASDAEGDLPVSVVAAPGILTPSVISAYTRDDGLSREVLLEPGSNLIEKEMSRDFLPEHMSSRCEEITQGMFRNLFGGKECWNYIIAAEAVDKSGEKIEKVTLASPLSGLSSVSRRFARNSGIGNVNSEFAMGENMAVNTIRELIDKILSGLEQDRVHVAISSSVLNSIEDKGKVLDEMINNKAVLDKVRRKEKYNTVRDFLADYTMLNVILDTHENTPGAVYPMPFARAYFVGLARLNLAHIMKVDGVDDPGRDAAIHILAVSMGLLSNNLDNLDEIEIFLKGLASESPDFYKMVMNIALPEITKIDMSIIREMFEAETEVLRSL